MKTLVASLIFSLLMLAISAAAATDNSETEKSDAQQKGAKAAARSSFLDEPVIPQSVFKESPQAKDPFFPNTTRRVVALPAHDANSEVTPYEMASLLKLEIFSRGLVTINGKTFEQGEAGDVKTSKGSLKIRCLEIRKTTTGGAAVVAIGDENTRVELKLDN